MTRLLAVLALGLCLSCPARGSGDFDPRWEGAWSVVEAMCPSGACAGEPPAPHSSGALVERDRFVPPEGEACAAPRYGLSVQETRALRPSLPEAVAGMGFSGNFVFAGHIDCPDGRWWFLLVDGRAAVLVPQDGDPLLLTRCSPLGLGCRGWLDRREGGQ